MKRYLILIAAALTLVPSLAFSNTMSVRLGYYLPKASGGPDSLWTIELDQMTFQRSDFNGTNLGFSYEYFVSKNLSFELSVDTYSRRKIGYYLDYIGFDTNLGNFAFPASLYEGGFDIDHSFNVSITPVQFSVKLLPIGRRNRIVPYVGGGIAAYFWNVNIRGLIVDFTDEAFYPDEELGDVPIYGIVQTDTRQNARVAFGYHGFAGLMVPIGNRITLSAEARYHAAKGKFSATGAFPDYEDFDLGGYALTAGLNYWF
jgi:hypothetical protein